MSVNSTALSNESCKVYLLTHPDPSTSLASIITFTLIYSFLFFTGLSGNVIIFYVTLRYRKLQTTQNILILNLVLADISLCLSVLPITPIFLIAKNWYFGSVMCHALPWLQGTTTVISGLSLMIVAIDRFMSVAMPHSKLRLTARGAWIVMPIVWSVSGIVILPYAYNMKIIRAPGYCGEFCTEDWPSDEYRQVFSVSVFIIQFVLPFSITAACYICIGVKIHQRMAQQMHRSAIQEDTRNSELSQRRRRSNLIIASMVIFYGLAWLPANVLSLVRDYTSLLADSTYTYFLYLITNSAAMSLVLTNPLVYVWLNTHFKREIIDIVKGKRVGNGSNSYVRSGLLNPNSSVRLKGISQAAPWRKNASLRSMLTRKTFVHSGSNSADGMEMRPVNSCIPIITTDTDE